MATHISRDEELRARAAFHEAYGATLAQWGHVEQRLFRWFQAITGMPDAMARGVFYSAKNFNARADMLSAAIAAANLPWQYRRFLKDTIKRARDYNGFRNTITHGEAWFDDRRRSTTFKQMILVQGKKPAIVAGK